MTNTRNNGFNASSPELSGADSLARQELSTRYSELRFAGTTARAVKPNDPDAQEPEITTRPSLEPAAPTPFYEQPTQPLDEAPLPENVSMLESAHKAIEDAQAWGEAA